MREYFSVLCSYEGCTKLLRIRKDNLKTHSRLCMSHARSKRPFEATYNRLFQNNRRNIVVELTYEDFLEFTKIKNCTYCGVELIRNSRATFLDRKDSSGPYSKFNCVACCASCNSIKSDLLTYEEMRAAMKAVLKVRNNGS